MFCSLRQKGLPFFVAVTFFYIFISVSAGGARANALPENPKELSWHISALKVTFDNKRDLYIAQDDVVITGGKPDLKQTMLNFRTKQKMRLLKGMFF